MLRSRPLGAVPLPTMSLSLNRLLSCRSRFLCREPPLELERPVILVVSLYLPCGSQEEVHVKECVWAF